MAGKIKVVDAQIIWAHFLHLYLFCLTKLILADQSASWFQLISELLLVSRLPLISFMTFLMSHEFEVYILYDVNGALMQSINVCSTLILEKRISPRMKNQQIRVKFIPLFGLSIKSQSFVKSELKVIGFHSNRELYLDHYKETKCISSVREIIFSSRND